MAILIGGCGYVAFALFDYVQHGANSQVWRGALLTGVGFMLIAPSPAEAWWSGWRRPRFIAGVVAIIAGVAILAASDL